MDKLSRKRVKKKIVDQMLNHDIEPATFVKIKTWHSSEDANFDGIIASLNYLNFKILQKFAIDDEESFKMVFLLCLTPQGHECMVIIPHIDCKEAIVVQTESASLVPHEIKSIFVESLKNSSTAFAFLTHHGIDGVGNSGNYSYDDQEVALKALKRGTKFYMPLPIVDYDDLVSTIANNNIGTFVNQSSETTLFSKMLVQSEMKSLLDSNGPYTVFAPTDRAIRTSFEDNGEFLFSPENYAALKAFVLNHIFLGSRDKSYNGKLMSIQGQEYEYNGSLSGVKMIEEMHSFSKANGFVSLIDSVLEPTNLKNIEIDIPLNDTISSIDIASTSYDIWKTQDRADRKVRQDIREQLAMIANAINTQENRSKTNMKDLGQEIISLDETLQDMIFDIQVTTNEGKSFTLLNEDRILTKLENIKQELSDKNEKYGEYMKSSYRLAALKYILAVAAKIGRDA